MKNGFYYIGYGWQDDCTIEDPTEHIPTYKEALKKALKSHKVELSTQREEFGNKHGEVMNTYVVLYEGGEEYIMAEISGWGSKVTEYEYD